MGSEAQAERLVRVSPFSLLLCERSPRESLLIQSELTVEQLVNLEKISLSPSTCAKDVIQSNRILIDGWTLEEWLSAQMGKSPCEFCCAELGDKAECRTVEIDGHIYETIPAGLIIQAGLLAASKLIGKDLSNIPCCEPKKKSGCP